MSWATRNVHTARSRLDSTFRRIESIPLDHVELKSDYSRYLCVLVSGFLERAVIELINNYVSAVSHPRAARLVEKKIHRTSNLNAEELTKLIGFLDRQWRAELIDFLGDERKDTLNSLIALRHDIAHGGPSGISLTTVSAYYKSVKEVVSFLERLLEP